LTAEKWKPFTLPFVQKFLWDGLQNTLQITAVSGVLALPLGVVFALLRLSRRPAIRWNATSYHRDRHPGVHRHLADLFRDQPAW